MKTSRLLAMVAGLAAAVSHVLLLPARSRRRLVACAAASLAVLPMAAVVSPTAQAAPGEVSYVGSASTAGSRTNHTVRIPSTVQAGDTLVMFLTVNSTTGTLTDSVAGWTLLQSRDGNDVRGRVWTKTAAAADSNANVTVTTGSALKSVVGVAAYRGTGGASISASAVGGNNASSSTHAAPSVPVAAANSWLVSVWSEKSNSAQTWTLPTGVTSRTSQSPVASSGKVSAVLADSNGAVPAGTAAALTATTSAAANRSVTFSLVVAPTDVPDPVNQPPVAAFTSACDGLRCEFDASATADPDSENLTYSWNFGDGTAAGTGKTTAHTYATSGQRTVTLTVSDGELNDDATGQVIPTQTATQGAVSFVAAATTSGNRSGHTVRIPDTVKPNDRLLLFLTTNTTTSTINNALQGWSLLQSRDGSDIRGRVWTKTAVPSDIGSEITVTTSALTKSTLSVAAYRSTGHALLSASAVRGVDSPATSLATPTVPVTAVGSWLVNSWAEKSNNTQTWTLPTGVTSRTSGASTGTGKVSQIVGDSGAAVTAGTAAARTATTSASASRSIMFSIVVDPGADLTGTNEPPTAEFTVGCAALTCDVDAGFSFDPDESPLTYSWNFGDNSTASGLTASRTYATPGTRTITLTVSDGTHNDTYTQVATTVNASPAPGHTRLVPDIPRTNMPLISGGEIWDFEVVGNRVYVAGGFTSLRNTTGSTANVAQANLAAFNLSTGLIDTAFRPTFGEGGVEAVEASPDGTKLYVAGTFNTVNGIAKRGIARLDPATGAPVQEFTANGNGKGSELAVTNTTVYVGGRFTTINNIPRSALAALDAVTGTVKSDFVNNITGGVGTNGELTVQRLELTRDEGRLLVIHTGRQVNGQNRYGVALINARTNKLLPWRTRLWEDNLQFVGGIQRIYGGDVSPDGQWFVASSGSGGDRPPINDTVVAYPMEGGDDVQPLWISRLFDSVYSVAVSETAVYVGGHFSWNESPTSPQPWPGLDDQGYGTGQGLSGYGLGDAVVRRDHLGALNPVDGTALEWNPGSNSFEGDKAMEVTSRGLFVGGDGQTKGEYNVGRVAFFDFNTVAAGNGVETTITDPIEGRVKEAGVPFTITGNASANAGVQRVEVEVMDANSRRYLNDNLTTWGTTTSNTINATLTSQGATSTTWSLPLTFSDNRALKVLARTISATNSADPTKATKKFETFQLSDRPPGTSVSGPGSPVETLTFEITGSATDDVGVNSVSVTLRDTATMRYLQDDGTANTTYNSFQAELAVVGATSTTWTLEVTLPYEGNWQAQARSTDTAGQGSLDTADRTWLVTEGGIAPSVSISQPVTMLPPTSAQPVVVAPGSPMTFAGSATDDEDLYSVEITLRNTTTGESLASDGTWGVGQSGSHRISPLNLSGTSYNWSYTTPFNLTPGSYSFTVRAEDDLGLATSSTNQGRLTINVQIAGDAPPNGLITPTGTITGLQTLHLDLAGTATDDVGVAEVRVSLEDRDTSRFLQPNGSMSAAFATRNATLETPNGTTTAWTLPIDLPTEGDWAVTVYAYDTAGQRDTSTSGATARYPIYPGDLPPTFNEALLSPTEGATFAEGKIFVSGRAEDDRAMESVGIGIINSLGQYMSNSGTFTSTTASYRTAFLNSPGTPGSNFSYTTPVIPPGTYIVEFRATDTHGQSTVAPLPRRNVTVTHPANNPPVASFTFVCGTATGVTGAGENDCSFDARSSTDENAATLTYSWSWGTTPASSGSGPVPKKTFTSLGTAAGVYTVTLTARDEWGVLSTPVTQTVTITEPSDNVAPIPVINTPACAGLSCNISGVGTTDPNTAAPGFSGDTFTYLWNFGDGTATSTASAMTHAFPAAGTYTVSLTATDGWGKAATVTREITVTAP